MYETANKLIEQYDVRSGEGAKSITRGMSGGNQQKQSLLERLNLTRTY